MTLHEELLEIRKQGVPLSGICSFVSMGNEYQLDGILKNLKVAMDRTHTSWVFPLYVPNIEGHERARQYNTVMAGANVSYKHDYLCERWALLNYLINETE